MHASLISDGRFGDDRGTENLDIWLQFGPPGEGKIKPVSLADKEVFTENLYGFL